MYFKKLGFEFIVVDFFMFINDIIIVIIYMNDILFINLDKINIQMIKNKFHEKFEITDLNLYIYYLDIMIVKNRFEQIIYIEKFFIDYNMIESALISIFIINDKFYIIEDDFVIIDKSRYIY